jgi:tetratricopeptide (TPR) repeat protein
MKPYPVLNALVHPGAVLLLCLLGGFLVTGLLAGAEPLHASTPASTISSYRAADDPQVKVALDDFYNLEYDKAISQFQRIEKAHPEDPFAVVHVLQVTVFRELYRLNLLDTTLYAHDGFLTGQPANGNPAVRAQVDQLAGQVVRMCDQRLAKNPNEVDALYVRGEARGLKSTYIALVDKSFIAALRNAVAARHDHERVLEIDPKYIDAKTIVGAHNYVVGSLPMPVKVVAGMAGLGGSKKKGLEYLEEASKEGHESSVDARVALALFLRREGRYSEAGAVVRTLTAQYQRNFLFALEQCNLLKDGGKGAEAIGCYQKLVDGAKAGRYPGAHIEFATFGMAESMRGQKDYEGALKQYEFTANVPNGQLNLRQRAELAAGEMYDVLRQRDQAIHQYQAVIAQDNSSTQAEIARKLLRDPYRPD